MQLQAELSQRSLNGAQRLFTMSLSLADADELFQGVQDYGDVYLSDVLREISDILPTVTFEPSSAHDIVDQLIRKGTVTLSADNVDLLEEAIVILTSGLHQTLRYIKRARAFAGTRLYSIELSEDEDEE